MCSPTPPSPTPASRTSPDPPNRWPLKRGSRLGRAASSGTLMTSRQRQGCEPRRSVGWPAQRVPIARRGAGLWTGGGGTQQSPRPTADTAFSAEPRTWSSEGRGSRTDVHQRTGHQRGCHPFLDKSSVPPRKMSCSETSTRSRSNARIASSSKIIPATIVGARSGCNPTTSRR